MNEQVCPDEQPYERACAKALVRIAGKIEFGLANGIPALINFS